MLKKYYTLDSQAERNCIYEEGGLGDSAKVCWKMNSTFHFVFFFFFII